MLKLDEEHDYVEAFDVLVECGMVDKDVAAAIIDLGYYSAIMNKENFEAFNRGERYEPPEFSIRCDACDGLSEDVFQTREDLIDAVRDYAHGSYWDGPNKLHSDYCRYYVRGCTLAEAGVRNSDGFCEVEKQ
jgi:hypothetical protein